MMKPYFLLNFESFLIVLIFLFSLYVHFIIFGRFACYLIIFKKALNYFYSYRYVINYPGTYSLKILFFVHLNFPCSFVLFAYPVF